MRSRGPTFKLRTAIRKEVCLTKAHPGWVPWDEWYRSMRDNQGEVLRGLQHMLFVDGNPGRYAQSMFNYFKIGDFHELGYPDNSVCDSGSADRGV